MKKLIILFFKCISFFTQILPLKILRIPGHLLGVLWYDVFKIRKQIILNNLQLAMPELSTEEKYRIARRSVLQMGEAFSDLFVIPSMSDEWLEKNVQFHGVSNLISAKEKKQGVFFLTLHLGSGDLASNAIAKRFGSMAMITKKFKLNLLNDFWFSIRGGQGIHYVDAHNPQNAFEIIKLLKKNYSVVFVLDQFMGKPFGVPTEFFGHRTGTAYGLALFAQKVKSPVLPVYTYNDESGKVHIVFDHEIDINPFLTQNKEESLIKLTQKFCDVIEGIIRKHPDQWMWVHRRWKSFE